MSRSDWNRPGVPVSSISSFMFRNELICCKQDRGDVFACEINLDVPKVSFFFLSNAAL